MVLVVAVARTVILLHASSSAKFVSTQHVEGESLALTDNALNRLYYKQLPKSLSNSIATCFSGAQLIEVVCFELNTAKTIYPKKKQKNIQKNVQKKQRKGREFFTVC